MQIFLYLCSLNGKLTPIIDMKTKRIIVILTVVMSALMASAQSTMEQYWTYVAEWREVALEQEDIYHIPASITMAQALLESAAGQSQLSREANNHFGIKCGGAWMGEGYYMDDDSAGECFRVYPDAARSFVDHSEFLQKPRYKSLYELSVEDYRGWAVRIRECGYATDPNYANKLIRIIEDYGLDTLRSEQWRVPSPEEQKQIRLANAAKRATTPTTKVQTPVVTEATTPERSESEDSESVLRGADERNAAQERRLFYQQHTRRWDRTVPYVEAKAGDTYANIAYRLNRRERRLRVNNDALGLPLRKGERVYLCAKHKYGAPNQEHVEIWVKPGESVRLVAQREVMRVATIYKLNGISPKVKVFDVRQKILIRKPKKQQQ